MNSYHKLNGDEDGVVHSLTPTPIPTLILDEFTMDLNDPTEIRIGTKVVVALCE